jgi:hypothetical protein
LAVIIVLMLLVFRIDRVYSLWVRQTAPIPSFPDRFVV